VNNIQTRDFIQRKFSEYYYQNIDMLQPPTSLEKREFAFLLFKEKAMLRHKGFKNAQAFRNSLQSITPSDVYYSCAYYENPEEEMTAKSWIGADLIFDIDADHIPTPCNKEHDLWTCKNCGMSGRRAKPERCPKCMGQKFDDLCWPCDICLGSAKEEMTKLIDMLDKDFGLSVNEMNLAFSGHRGYHVIVESDALRTLDSMARKEIVDYLMGIGLDPTLQGLDLGKGMGPSLEDSGWRGRIAKGTYELLSASKEQLEGTELKHLSETISQQKEQILERWKRKGPWGLVSGVGAENWAKIVQQAIRKKAVNIDTVVTTDIHRLIRMANTLHGETGLLKTVVPMSEIEGFDPFKRAVAFRHGTIAIDISEAPEFRLNDTHYGPYKNEKVDLPTAAAMLLLCKGVAGVMEETTHIQ
jgi:DNA primase small subunit